MGHGSPVSHLVTITEPAYLFLNLVAWPFCHTSSLSLHLFKKITVLSEARVGQFHTTALGDCPFKKSGSFPFCPYLEREWLSWLLRAMHPILFYPNTPIWRGKYAHPQFLNFEKYILMEILYPFIQHMVGYFDIVLEIDNPGRSTILFCLTHPLGCSSHPWGWEMWLEGSWDATGWWATRLEECVLIERVSWPGFQSFCHELAAWYARKPDLIS